MRMTTALPVFLSIIVLGGEVRAQWPPARWYVADGQVVSEGLKPINTTAGDDKFQIATLGGVEAICANVPGSSWIRVALDPPLPQDWRKPLTVGVKYLDDMGQLQLQYDSSDPARLINGAWAWSPIQWRGGTKTWKTAYWTIDKPGFTHRQLGADFGLRGGGGPYAPPWVAEMSVTPASVVLSSEVRGLALGDKQPAKITATVVGVDGQPAADGTAVRFTATLGQCVPAEAAVAGGQATTLFVPFDKPGEAVVSASCDFSGGELRLPLVTGSGGVREVEWVVDDFEAANAAEVTKAGHSTGVSLAVEVSPDAAHSGRQGALATYKSTGERDYWQAGPAHYVPLPGVLLGMSFWAKCSEPNVELRWSLEDETEEMWTFFAPVLERGEDGWARRGSGLLDPYPTHDDAVLNYPLNFLAIWVMRNPWSRANSGTLVVDDIVARLLVANSEVEQLKDGLR